MAWRKFILFILLLTLFAGAKMEDKIPNYFVMDARKPVTFNLIQSWPSERRGDLQIIVFSLDEIKWVENDKSESAEQQRGHGKIDIVDVIYSGGHQIKKNDHIWITGDRPSKAQYSLDGKNVMARTRNEITMIYSKGDNIVMFAGDKNLYVAVIQPSEDKNFWKIDNISPDFEETFSGGKSFAGFRDKLRSVVKKKFNNENQIRKN